MKTRVLSMFLALVMALGLCVPALAADEFQAEEPIAPMEEEVPAAPVEAEEEAPAEGPVAVAAEPVVMDETQPAATVLASGNCGRYGSSVNWTLTSDGTLTIFGKGAIDDYIIPDGWYYTPWEEYCSNRFWDQHQNLDDDELIDYTDYMTIITKIVVQEGVTRIGTGALINCVSVKSVSLPNSLTEIGDSAFSHCGMTSISLPGGLKKIGAAAFNGCEKLTSITIPSGVTGIGEGAFEGCTSLTSINVESGSKNYVSIDGVLFSADKKALITYPDGKKGSYTIPNGVATIRDSAFGDCDKLTGITIPNSVTSIEKWAFWGCSSLTSVTIPASVTSIGDDAFVACISLTSINVESGSRSYASIDGVLFSADKKTLVTYPAGKEGNYTIPNGVAAIGESAFQDCDKLTGITIPNSVTSIGEYAFSESDLTSVTIPVSVTSIGNFAFAFCTSLSDVYYDGTQKQWGRIKIGYNNEALTSATIHYNSSGPAETAPHKDGWAWENNAHCFYRNGVKVRNDWVYTEGHYYWMKADGTMAWNEKVTVNGKDYYLGESGRMQTGWIKLPNGKDYYYADISGALKKAAWQKWGNEKYWLMPDGLMARNTLATATYGSGSRIFSFSDSGKVEKGWISIGNGDFRYGDPNAGGALARNQWVKWGGKWYWLKDNCMMARNEKLLISGSYYYFYDNGIMGTGWIHIGNGDYYYASSSGNLRSNYLFTYSGKQCYIKSNYLMARNETLTINGVSYTFDNSGYAVKRAQGNRPLDENNLKNVNRIPQEPGSCWATSVAMAANLIVGSNRYGTHDFTTSKTSNTLRNLNNDSTIYTGIDGKQYKAYKSDSKGVSRSQLQTAIENALNAGLPISVSVHSPKGYTSGTHYVTVVGWTDSSHTDYYVVNPGYPDKVSVDTIWNSRYAMRGVSHWGKLELGNDDGTYYFVSFQEQ